TREGRMEISAQPTSGVVVDGRLDDAAWQAAPPVGAFVQAEPDEGSPASARTDAWIAFDHEFLYVAAYCADQPTGIVINDIRKDFGKENQDVFEVILDTFGDRRNGYVFATNPAGARADEQVTNEGRDVNSSWDAPWVARTQRVADGWTLEMAIPLRSIRSREGGDHWGINFSRRIRRRNEVSYWAPIPRAYTIHRLSLAGDLTGVQAMRRGRDLRLTPYVAAQSVRETGGSSFAQSSDLGGNLKYGLTKGLTLDLTVNPDFAQAEADEQQVNLTQFSQFFPEKRDFFLENAGLFYLGDTPRNRRVSLTPNVDEDLLLFFSRSMGLAADGRLIDIDGGIRLTGQEAGFLIGALAARTQAREEIPGNDYTVVRLRRNLFASSDLGGLFMMRSAVDNRGDYNRVYGVDANIRLPGRIDWTAYLVTTETPGLTADRGAFFTSLNREGNFLHVKGGVLGIGRNFNDELGFYRRTGVVKWSLDTGIRPRFAALRQALGVRELHPHVVWAYYADFDGNTVAARYHNGLSVFFSNGAFGELSLNPREDLLTQPFVLHPDAAPVPAGRHAWPEYQLRLTSDESRALSATVTAITGGLWNGNQRTINGAVTVKPSHRFRATLGLQRTRGDLEGPGNTFTREIWTGRANYSFHTDMFVDALVQYDADRDRLNLNVRFNLLHHPLSNLYLVWNEQRFTPADPVLGAPAPGRSLVVKLTHMLAF
ncbi:MAG TPA: DUF5916 domain-containing protein, partial [Gemmatimonadales bacterium]|nr:DUF5916 domain-containing protein [Gemmatimonadales bacterium]